ncbi:MAG: tyrosine--tRNA ligase [Bacteroidales bacterium]|nr:tyrosine--tRNA ligase [Bacteroidales bacterium]
MKDFAEELRWRGMIHTIMPGTEEQLKKGMQTAYVGIDPTADSLHIGHLVSIMIMAHFQACGHKPLIVVGGATGMIGDPSFKSSERVLLTPETINHNLQCIKKQVSKFLNFDASAENHAEILNNYDWTKEWSFIDFIREIGKHITVNYMMAKDSVKKRIETGISFTEFSYQLLQGYDYLYLYQNHNCRLQLGGSDQWGNITTGTELIKRVCNGEAYALTCPLITKADGKKFGKTEKGNIWLDKEKTSPYQFYQFWLNLSDEDAKRFIRIFTLLPQEEILALESEHDKQPEARLLQKTLAKDITIRVHSQEDYDNAIEASQILFGKGTKESLSRLDEMTFLSVFDGVPQFRVAKSEIEAGIPVIDLLAEKTQILSSKGEVRRELKGNSLSINKEKITDAYVTNSESLLNNKYILVQKGKKNYFIIIAE